MFDEITWSISTTISLIMEPSNPEIRGPSRRFWFWKTCWNIYLVLVFHMNWHIFPFFKIIIIKQVRSNTLGAVGFLGDSRRINVAITRARKHLALVCDSSTICHNTFLARLLRHIRHFGRVKHAEPGSFGGYGLGMNPILPSIN